MAHLSFDRAKMKELGNGSIKEFCEIYNIRRNNLYRIENTRSKVKGTYAQELTNRLISMGCARWVNDDEERAS